jgi:predicted RNase H-like nuclease (RuvC/YqgF family)
MTNPELQKELKEKIKEGIKPSDLKKQKVKPKTNEDERSLSGFDKSDEGYISEEEEIIIPTIPTNKELQNQIASLQRQLQNYKDFKEADLRIKEKYKKEIERWKKAVEKSNTLMAEKEKTIRELEAKITEQYKTIEGLKSEGENKEIIKQENKETFNCYNCKNPRVISLLVLELPEGKLCQVCWKEFRRRTKENTKYPDMKPKETIQTFTCHNCQETKKEKEYRVKLDSSLLEYSVCLACLPLVKEYNEKEGDSERELEEWE